MVLVLTAQAAEEQSAEGGVVRRRAETEAEVLSWLEAEEFKKIILSWPPPPALNPFALSRALRRANGPRLVVVGAPRPDLEFWAERNGCLLAEDLAEAMAKE